MRIPTVACARAGVSKDQPVTFKTKIKSSGYNTAPAAASFLRSASSSSARKPAPKQAGKGAVGSVGQGGGGGGILARKCYPADADLPKHKQAGVEACAAAAQVVF